MITDVRTVLQDLPVAIRGFVVTDENGDPTIVLKEARLRNHLPRQNHTHKTPQIHDGQSLLRFTLTISPRTGRFSVTVRTLSRFPRSGERRMRHVATESYHRKAAPRLQAPA